MTAETLSVGFSIVDITPPEGLAMAGGLDPRPNEGTHSDLKAKVLYATDGSGAVAIAGIDLLGLPGDVCDAIIERASQLTGLEPGSILISCSHTHSGPYLQSRPHLKDVVDESYVGSLPERIAGGIARAVDSAAPATMHLGRSLVFEGLHHRRVISKRDGLAINTWMRQQLNDLEAVPQVVGTAGPIDPELWVARFDGADGRCLGVLVNLSLHVNARGGTLWSADYPAVIAERLADYYGEQAISVFTPGACANVNPTFGGERWQDGAELIASRAVEAAGRAERIEGPIAVAARRRDVAVPRRDPATQREGAVDRLNWQGRGGRRDVFGPRIAAVSALPEKLWIPVSAARIGPLGIATNAGELFVEWGLEIKRRSPFPHTIVTELTNDSIGYQPDAEAFEREGYETLIGPNRISQEGIQMLVDQAVTSLEGLWHEENQNQ